MVLLQVMAWCQMQRIRRVQMHRLAGILKVEFLYPSRQQQDQIWAASLNRQQLADQHQVPHSQLVDSWLWWQETIIRTCLPLYNKEKSTHTQPHKWHQWQLVPAAKRQRPHHDQHLQLHRLPHSDLHQCFPRQTDLSRQKRFLKASTAKNKPQDLVSRKLSVCWFQCLTLMRQFTENIK